MGLFNKNNKENIGFTCALCNNDESAEADVTINEKIESIKVLGAGCPSCHKQYEYVKETIEKLGMNVELEYVTDLDKVMEYGVMSMPSLVINEKVVATGKLLKHKALEKLFL